MFDFKLVLDSCDAQGKLLYEKGGLNTDNLPEEIMAAVEEDYQTCCRLLARGKTK